MAIIGKNGHVLAHDLSLEPNGVELGISLIKPTRIGITMENGSVLRSVLHRYSPVTVSVYLKMLINEMLNLSRFQAKVNVSS